MSTLRTLCTLTPGEKQNGVKCLRGSLSRSITTTDPAGNERTYPVGTRLVLSKSQNGSYRLLAMLPDEGETASRLSTNQKPLGPAQR